MAPADPPVRSGDATGRYGASARSASEPGSADYAAPMSETPDELLRLRASIDNMDQVMIRVLAERFKITQQVGHLKASLGLPPSDPGREEQQIGRLRVIAVDAGLDPEFAEQFLAFVVREVIRNHEAIADRHPDEA